MEGGIATKWLRMASCFVRICDLLNHHQRSSHFQEMAKKKYRDSQSDIMQRVRDHGIFNPKWDVSSDPSPQGSRTLRKRRQKKSKIQRDRTLRKQGPLNQHDRCTYEDRHGVWGRVHGTCRGLYQAIIKGKMPTRILGRRESLFNVSGVGI